MIVSAFVGHDWACSARIRYSIPPDSRTKELDTSGYCMDLEIKRILSVVFYEDIGASSCHLANEDCSISRASKRDDATQSFRSETREWIVSVAVRIFGRVERIRVPVG